MYKHTRSYVHTYVYSYLFMCLHKRTHITQSAYYHTNVNSVTPCSNEVELTAVASTNRVEFYPTSRVIIYIFYPLVKFPKKVLDILTPTFTNLSYF